MDDGNEHWLEQRRMCDDYANMNAPHERARTVAQQSKGIQFGGSLGNDEMSLEDRSRTLTTSGQTKQVWSELDLGGQGLRALSSELFRSYQFLTRLDLGHNHLHQLPPEIGKLKNLEFLDLSYNELEYLPEEIGMLTNLKTLLLFANQIQVLNPELGYLQNLETLGIYGNPMDDELKLKMSEGGTKKLILYLRETMPGKQNQRQGLSDTNKDQNLILLVTESGTYLKTSHLQTALWRLAKYFLTTFFVIDMLLKHCTDMCPHKSSVGIIANNLY
jgi:CCR4-NOT transcription complex subunit 6